MITHRSQTHRCSRSNSKLKPKVYTSFAIPFPLCSPGLKSIMKKNGVADKQGNKGAKKNLKFVGVNGG